MQSLPIKVTKLMRFVEDGYKIFVIVLYICTGGTTFMAYYLLICRMKGSTLKNESAPKVEGGPAARWIKDWPADLPVPIWIPKGENIPGCKRGSTAHRYSLSLSSSHHADMTKIRLERT